MPSVVAYHRPGSLDEAQSLVADGERRLIGGGTVVVAEAVVPTDEGTELVDLQGLGLDSVEADGDRLVVGAMARLGELATDDRVPDLLRQLARRELPSALRNQASVGGTVALADPESVLLAGLLVHGAVVHRHGADPVPLGELLVSGVGPSIVTAVAVETAGTGAIASAGRTPADVPIVAAVARLSERGPVLALTGVAATAVLVDPSDPGADLSPQGDFRGSADYRLHLASVLSARAMAEVSP